LIYLFARDCGRINGAQWQNRLQASVKAYYLIVLFDPVNCSYLSLSIVLGCALSISMPIKLVHGDSYKVLAEMEENSVDSIVCDPPYMIGFMGKKFDDPKDNVAADPGFWKLCLKVLKPGGHLLAFGGTRTYHRMAVAIEDSGFEVRDTIVWTYGQGFPKSHAIGKAVDKLQGNEREEISRGGKCGVFAHSGSGVEQNIEDYEAVVTKGTSEWEGWGTALKPAHEPICLARKPLSEKTIVENVLRWNVGALNIDGCRVGTEERTFNSKGISSGGDFVGDIKDFKGQGEKQVQGRFPSNFILSCECEEVIEGATKPARTGRRGGSAIFGSETIGTPEKEGVWPEDKQIIHTNPNCPCYMLDEQAPYVQPVGGAKKTTHDSGMFGIGQPGEIYKDKGGPSRFFLNVKGDRFRYVAKASKRERNKGCEGLEEVIPRAYRTTSNGESDTPSKGMERFQGLPTKNHHPTVKPIKLMQYLCRLITPPNGTVLDPFMGSGSTGIAAKLEGFGFIGIEMEEEYVEIGKARIEAWEPDPQGELF